MLAIKLCSKILVAISATGLALTLFSFGIWPFETASLWVPFYLLTGLLGSCGLAFLGNYRSAGLGALCAVIALALMTPLYLPCMQPDTRERAPSLRFLQANVYSPGADPNALLDVIRGTRPDIILLQEVDEKWKGLLKPLEELYPNRHHSPRYKNGSLDLAQYWMGEAGEVKDLYIEGIPATEIVLHRNGGLLCVLNVHTAAPFTRGREEWYQKQMDLLARYITLKECPVVLAGDLNAGLWSRNYAHLLEVGGLHSARLGFGGLGTWPSFFPGPLRIALDHLLVSDGIRVRRCWVGPGIGSDHRPLMTELQIGVKGDG